MSRIGVDFMEQDGFCDVSFMLHCAVYALVQRGEVVYIGSTKAPLTRLYSHTYARGKLEPWKAGYNKRKVGFRFSGIWVRPCMLGELEAIENEMIRKYQPKYNVRGKSTIQITEMPASVRAMLDAITMKPALPEIDRRGM